MRNILSHIQIEPLPKSAYDKGFKISFLRFGSDSHLHSPFKAADKQNCHTLRKSLATEERRFLKPTLIDIMKIYTINTYLRTLLIEIDLDIGAEYATFPDESLEEAIN